MINDINLQSQYFLSVYWYVDMLKNKRNRPKSPTAMECVGFVNQIELVSLAGVKFRYLVLPKLIVNVECRHKGNAYLSISYYHL